MLVIAPDDVRKALDALVMGQCSMSKAAGQVGITTRTLDRLRLSLPVQSDTLDRVRGQLVRLMCHHPDKFAWRLKDLCTSEALFQAAAALSSEIQA